MKLRLLALFACLSFAFTAPALAAGETPLFSASDAIHLTIQAPLQSLMRDRDNRGPVAGTLTEPNGQALPVSLALRGITRRTSEICDFAPLRVDFTTPPPPTSLFAGQKRLKLVTHCKNAASFQQLILLEYSAYRMFNLLSPKSFRVRLANIDYRGADGRPIVSRVGFFLEDLGDVAKRNGTIETRAGERIPVSNLSPPDAARYGLFQYMIANQDWSMRAGPAGDECCHNARLIGPLAPGQTVPVPYDFDFSGLVSAPYAGPPPEIDIADVRQRLYRGYCIHNADAIAAARQFRALQPQILGVLAQTPGMEPRTQQRAASFLGRFFADIATDDSTNTRVLRRCVG
jgi:hypothetical protein